MVSRVQAPDHNDEELLNAIVEERQGGVNRDFFNGIHVEWAERIQEYRDEGGNPETVLEWPLVKAAANATKFLNLYNSPQPDATQREILRQLRHDHGYQFCPSCGEAGIPDTLDHYLPKQKFPHFAVTVSNLTPMCDSCQRKKGDDVGDVDNPKFFIHPYFDDFAADQLLRVEISPPFDTPTFELQICAAVPENVRSVVEQHVQKLELPKRYRSFFRNRFKRLQRQAQRCRDRGLDLRGILEMSQEDHEEQGRNTWDHVFVFSVLENDELLNYLAVEELPTYL